MSLEAEASKIYEARVITDALARLAKRFDLKRLPFSDDELQTLAERLRESFRAFGSEEKKERLVRYMAHLSTLYGEHCVGRISTALEQINNEIGYEEK
jgi:predicted Zn-dependent peptidase